MGTFRYMIRIPGDSLQAFRFELTSSPPWRSSSSWGQASSSSSTPGTSSRPSRRLTIQAYVQILRKPGSGGAEGHLLRFGLIGEGRDRQEALERLKARLGKLAEAVALLEENPLPPSVEVQVKKASFATVIARELIAMPEVEEVVYAGDIAERLQKISRFVSRLSLVVLVVSMASAALVLFNTIRIGVMPEGRDKQNALVEPRSS